MNIHATIRPDELAVCEDKFKDIDWGANNYAFVIIWDYIRPSKETFHKFKYWRHEARLYYKSFSVQNKEAVIIKTELLFSKN